MRSLLKKRFEVQTPPRDFTIGVMNEINAMADDKVHAEVPMKEMLKKNLLSEPRTGFTYKVLSQVREQPQVVYPPLISRRVWITIIAFVIICLLVAIADRRSAGPSTTPYFYLDAAEYLSNLTIRFIEPLFYFGFILLPATILLAIDFFLRKKLQSRM